MLTQFALEDLGVQPSLSLPWYAAPRGCELFGIGGEVHWKTVRYWSTSVKDDVTLGTRFELSISDSKTPVTRR